MVFPLKVRKARFIFRLQVHRHFEQYGSEETCSKLYQKPNFIKQRSHFFISVNQSNFDSSLEPKASSFDSSQVESFFTPS